MYTVADRFLELLDKSGSESISFSHHDIRTAIAVLYYRVIVVDGRIRREEMDHFRTLLSESMNVSEDELFLFEDRVLEHVRSESSLQPFTEIVRNLPIKKRQQILRHMEEISISDRELHEFEINLVARTAELLDLDDESREQAQKPAS